MMGFIYCITSKILRDDHYKIGMTICKDEHKLPQYFRSRYGTAYGCCVELTIYKKVGNPRVSESYVHNALMQYCKGGEIFNCTRDTIQKVFDSIPVTDEVIIAGEDTICTDKVPQTFIDDFFSSSLNDSKFTINFDVVVNWLKIRKGDLKRNIVSSYIKDTDYISEKNH